MTTIERETPTTIPDRESLGADPVPRPFESQRGRSDTIFKGTIGAAGLIVLAIMASVGTLLLVRSFDALEATGLSFLTEQRWEVERGTFGVASLVFFTAMIACVAVAIALPVSVLVALFIVEVVPGRIKSTLVAAVDLMAAVPSVVYGLWGALLLDGQLRSVVEWINTWLGWIPIFDVEGADPGAPRNPAAVYAGSTVIAGVVVSMMAIPIMTTVMREVFSQVPPGEREGAFALGATRWGMIRSVTLPFGRGGVIGGTMLGLGRALGETIAVVYMFTPRFDISFNVLEKGTNSISAHIAIRFPEASDFGLSALLAAGLVLFAITLFVNVIASIFIKRSRSGASSEA